MNASKNSFILYKSLYDSVSDLSDIELGQLFRAILQYQLGMDIDIEGEVRGIFRMIKSQFDADDAKYQCIVDRNAANGAMGGRPKKTQNTQSNPKNPVGFQKPKKADIDIDIDNDINRKKEITKVISKEREDTVPYGKIISAWNELCPSLPRILKITEGRRKKISSRLKEMTGNPEEYLLKCEELFRRIQSSGFLTGERGGQWTATFDWAFDNDKNWVKVMEGNYDNKDRSNTHPEVRLGVNEFFDGDRRTYGTGGYTIPLNAPPRPSDKHYWNTSTQQWLLM